MVDVSIGLETPADAAAIRAIHLAAFPTSAEADVVEAMRGSDGYIGLVAEADGEPAGHLVLTPVTLATGSGDRRGLGLAPMAVLPQHQKKGVGGALLRAAIEGARERGEEFIVVLGEPAYYERFGFRRAAPVLRWRSEQYDPYFLVLTLRGEEPSLAGTITYHPAIEALA